MVRRGAKLVVIQAGIPSENEAAEELEIVWSLYLAPVSCDWPDDERTEASADSVDEARAV